jgi:hypothetical protein
MSNINITEGSGKVVATDTIGGLEYQKVEIYSGQVSVLGTVAVTQSGAWSASIVGTLPSSILGTVPVTQSGTFSSSVYGTYTTPDNFVSGVTSVMQTTSSVMVLSAPSGTARNYVTHIMATNGGAVGTYVNIVDGGQVIYAGYAAASGGGFSATLPTPLKQPTSVQALYAATTATSSVVVAMSGYKM